MHAAGTLPPALLFVCVWIGCGGGGTTSSSSTSSSAGGGTASSSSTSTSSSSSSSSSTSGSSSSGGGFGGMGGHGGGAPSDAGPDAADGGGMDSGAPDGGDAGIVDAGPGGLGAPCSANAGCEALLYCDQAGCGMSGVCAQKPVVPLNVKDPVCGCDGVTYWNADVAAFKGASVKFVGACPPGVLLGCSANNPCPAGLKCSLPVADAAACASPPGGSCWGLPNPCPLGGVMSRSCTVSSCEGECALIASNNPYWPDPSCP